LTRDDVSLDQLRAASGEFARLLDDYLNDFGVRATAYDVLAPTLGEQEGLILSAIVSEDDYDPDEVERAQTEAREQALEEARESLAEDPTRLQRFNEMVARIEQAYPVREDNIVFTDNAPVGLVRLTALEIGSRLAERGIIDDSGHVLFLTIDEARESLRSGTARHEIVRRRRGEREWALRNPPVPSFGEDPGPPPDMRAMPEGVRRLMDALGFFMAEDMSAEKGDGLSGTPASAGSYTGPARVVLSEDQFSKVRPGDVMVCPITTPAWSVLFGRIGGLVTDTGGLLSHSAIVAREHAIPAVVGTGSATTEIEDGQTVTVNGTTGNIEVHD
ncbi:MAG: PEP-utilizing enzyme, partial [Halobacteriales archaeon]|nr:PEP-utilizing enzyme [Halobacteriales archaeon]